MAIRRVPLYIIGGIIVILEISKQIKNFTGFYTQNFFSFITGDRAELDYWAFPFHFCSFFVFWCLFQLIFIKNEKLSTFFDNMAFLWATFTSILLIFYPAMVYGSPVEGFYSNGILNHSTLFHWLVLLYWGLSLALRTFKFETKKVYQAPICILIFGTIALPAAHLLQQNYCSLYYPDGWDFLMPIYEKGIVYYDGFLVILGVTLITSVYLACIGVGKLRDKVKDNKRYLIGYLLMIPAQIVLLLISKNGGYDPFGSMYAIYLVIVAFICQLPATFIGHIKAIIRVAKAKNAAC